MSALKRIQRNLSEVTENPVEGISAGPEGEDLFTWQVLMSGPENTPYEDGVFMLELLFPSNYPFAPPKLAFKTKIYHCNVNSKGGICLDILKDAWSPLITPAKVIHHTRVFDICIDKQHIVLDPRSS